MGMFKRSSVEPLSQPLGQAPRRDKSKEPTFDRRKADRLPLDIPLAYAFLLPGELLRGATTALNVSGTGLQFPVDRMISPQTSCQIDLSLPAQSKPLTLVGRVVWCRQAIGRRKGPYEVGIEFTFARTADDPMFAKYSAFIATQLLAKHLR